MLLSELTATCLTISDERPFLGLASDCPMKSIKTKDMVVNAFRKTGENWRIFIKNLLTVDSNNRFLTIESIRTNILRQLFYQNSVFLRNMSILASRP